MGLTQRPYQIDAYTVLPQFREAIRKWNAGEPYECSMDIDDNPTYGYGYLVSCGFFVYPFPIELVQLDIIAAENKIRWDKIRDIR